MTPAEKEVMSIVAFLYADSQVPTEIFLLSSEQMCVLSVPNGMSVSISSHHSF